MILWKGLPFLRGAFVGEKSFVACGFDNVPVLLRNTGGNWQVCGSLDSGGASPNAGLSVGSAAPVSESQQASSFADAKSFFGRASVSATPGAGSTRHTNTITALSFLRGNRFTTSGLDGQVLVWELPA